MTQQRVSHCYDLMDSAYGVKQIHVHGSASEHVPIIDPNPRSHEAAHCLEQQAKREAGFTPPERVRHRKRSIVEWAAWSPELQSPWH